MILKMAVTVSAQLVVTPTFDQARSEACARLNGLMLPGLLRGYRTPCLFPNSNEISVFNSNLERELPVLNSWLAEHEPEMRDCINAKKPFF